MSGRALTNAIRRHSGNRAVRIKVEPHPQALSESRAILRLAESYGEVVSFVSLKYDPLRAARHTILTTFASDEAAAAFIQDCPRTLAMPRSQQQVYAYTDTDRQALDEPEETQAPRALSIFADPGIRDQQRDTKSRQQYWRYEVNPTSFSSVALLDYVPTPGYALTSQDGTMVPSRLVRRWIDNVASRPSAQQLLRADSTVIAKLYR